MEANRDATIKKIQKEDAVMAAKVKEGKKAGGWFS